MEVRASSLLPEVFLPPAIIQELSEPIGIHDKIKLALIQTVINISALALESYQKWKLEEFDALIGNFGCQVNALVILKIASEKALKVEIEQLGAKIKEIKASISPIKGKIVTFYHKEKSGGLSIRQELAEFFKNGLKNIAVSSEIAYLLKARFLTYAKVCPDNVTEWLDINKYIVLAKPGSTYVPVDILKQMVVKTRSDISHHSIAILQEISIKLPFHAVLAIVRKVVEKSYACQFYSMKAVLVYLKDNHVPIVAKKWIKKATDVKFASIFYQSTQESFSRILDENIEKLPQYAPCIVFEWDVSNALNREQLVQEFDKHGVENVILSNTAQEQQFERGDNGLKHIVDEFARSEIVRCANLGPKINSIKGNSESFAFLDHVYCSTVSAELWKEERGRF